MLCIPPLSPASLTLASGYDRTEDFHPTAESSGQTAVLASQIRPRNVAYRSDRPTEWILGCSTGPQGVAGPAGTVTNTLRSWTLVITIMETGPDTGPDEAMIITSSAPRANIEPTRGANYPINDDGLS
jgi:hypothetical protein